MAYSYVNYLAEGVSAHFDITFEYLKKAHVFVFVNNAMAAYSWVTPTRLEVFPLPEAGAEVRLQRLTDKAVRVTDFSDGQTLLAGDLDASALQLFYILQELIDGLMDGAMQGDIVLSNPLPPGLPVTTQYIQDALNEAARNSPVISDLLAWDDTFAAQLLAETEARLAEIVAETAARVAALQAEADARLAAVGVLQDQIDADVAELEATAAALTQEVTDRQAAVQAQADDLVAEALARLTEDQALDTRVDDVVALVAGNSAAIVTEATTRASETSANASLITALQTDVAGNAASLVTEQTARSDADTALASDITSLQAEMGTAQADIITVSEAVVSEGTARATAIAGLQTEVDDNAAAIITNATAISGETSARTTALTAMQSAVDDNAASIITEQTTRADADTAQVGDITVLQTSMGNAEAAIVTNATAISDETSARASDVTGLTARMSNAGFTSDFATQYPALFSGQHAGEDGSTSVENTAPDMSTAVVADVGVILTGPAGGTDILTVYMKKAVKIEEGKRYRMEITARITGSPTGPWTNRAISGFFRKMDENYGATSVQAVHWYPTALDTWETFSIDWVATAGNAYMRYGFYKRGDYGVTGGNVEVRSISFTEEGFGIQENEAAIISEASVRSSADSAQASDISALQTSMGDAEAAIVTNATAISDETSASTSAFSAMQSEVDDNAAAILSEQATRSDETSANAGDISALLTSMGDAEAAIITNATAISDETGARVSDVSALSARFGGQSSDTQFFRADNLEGFAVSGDTPVSSEPATYALVTDADKGPVIEVTKSTASGAGLYPRMTIPLKEGGAYEMRVMLKPQGTLSGGDPTNHGYTVGLDVKDATGTHLGQRRIYPILNISAGWTELVFGDDGTYTTDYFLSYYPTAAYIVPNLVVSRFSGEVTRVAWAQVKNLGDVVAAEALVTSEASTRASADTAQASDIAGLQTSMGDAEAAIITNATAVSTESSARATDVKELRVRMHGPDGFSLGFDDGFDDWMYGFAGDPKTAPAVTEWGIYNVAAVGNVAWAPAPSTSFLYCSLRPVLPNIAGKRYRVTGRMRHTGTDGFGATAVNFHSRSLTSSYLYALNLGGISVSFTARYAWSDVDFTITGDGTTPYLRISMYKRGDWNPSNGNVEFTGITVEEVGAVAQDLEASISTVNDVAIDAQGRATAMHALRVDVNGYVAGYGLSNDGATAQFAILADEFLIARPGNGAPVGTFFVNGAGVVYMTNVVIGGALIDELVVNKLTAGTLYADMVIHSLLSMGTGKIVFDNGVYMKVLGVAFGANNDLIEWYGPKMAITACTKTNSIMHADTIGNFYLGGGVKTEWASIQNIAVDRIDLTAGAVGAMAASTAVNNRDLTTNANPFAATDYIPYTAYGPSLPVAPGDAVRVELSYLLTAQYNSYEYFYWKDFVQLQFTRANGSTFVVNPSNYQKERISRRTSNTGGGANVGGTYTYPDSISNVVRCISTDPDIVSVRPYIDIRANNPGTATVCTWGGTGTIRQSSMKLDAVVMELQVFADGPLVVS
jgi:hypothetical protein